MREACLRFSERGAASFSDKSYIALLLLTVTTALALTADMDDADEDSATQNAVTARKSMALTEDLRRGTRNSMLWSLLALAAGIGQSSNPEINVSALGATLSFSHATLAFGALAGAIYMFVAYLRSLDHFVRENSQIAIETKSSEMIKIIGKLSEEAEDAITAIAKARHLSEELRLEAARQMSKFKRTIENMLPRTGLLENLRQIRSNMPIPSMMDGPGSGSVGRAVYNNLMECFDLAAKNVTKEDEGAITAIAEATKAVEHDLPVSLDLMLDQRDESISTYDAATQRLATVSALLRTFHLDFALRDKIYHRLLDVGAVAGLFLVGVAASTALIDGKSPTSDYPWLNPAITAPPKSARPSPPPTQRVSVTKMTRKSPEVVKPE